MPGHERFVRTMVAGATGIDLYLMVVAADDGVMPQTREHAAVLAALGVTAGVVAITKSDLADPARAARRGGGAAAGRGDRAGVRRARGDGLDELRAALDRAAAGLPGRAGGGPLRLHVDRSFTIRGAGTVVTGTLWSGTAARGDEVRSSRPGSRARVRAVQVHDEPVERAEAGQRVALNLAGVGRDEVARGDVVVGRATAPSATFRVDVALTGRRPTRGPTAARASASTTARARRAARLAELGGRFFQLRLEQPLVPARRRSRS